MYTPRNVMLLTCPTVVASMVSRGSWLWDVPKSITIAMGILRPSSVFFKLGLVDFDL